VVVQIVILVSTSTMIGLTMVLKSMISNLVWISVGVVLLNSMVNGSTLPDLTSGGVVLTGIMVLFGMSMASNLGNITTSKFGDLKTVVMVNSTSDIESMEENGDNLMIG